MMVLQVGAFLARLARYNRIYAACLDVPGMPGRARMQDNMADVVYTAHVCTKVGGILIASICLEGLASTSCDGHIYYESRFMTLASKKSEIHVSCRITYVCMLGSLLSLPAVYNVCLLTQLGFRQALRMLDQVDIIICMMAAAAMYMRIML